MARIAFIAAALACVALGAGPALAATTALDPKDVHWSFEGPLGMYDQAQLQRGYKVYREVCSSCHSMNMVAFRNLGDKGGPFWNPKYPNPNAEKSQVAAAPMALASTCSEPVTARPTIVAMAIPSTITGIHEPRLESAARATPYSPR